MLITCLIIMLAALKTCDCSNILAVLPISSKSHQYMFQPLVIELANRGHNVTIISPLQIDVNNTNLNQIIVHTSGENFIAEMEYEKILSLVVTLFIPPKMSFWFYGLMVSEDYLKSSEIQKLIHSTVDKFDLIMLETSFAQESLIGFSKKFDAPVITLNSHMNHLFLDEFIGNPLSLSFIPHVESQMKSPMSFYGRFWNFIHSFIVLTWGYNFYLPEQEMLMKKYFNFTAPENFPPIVEMLKNNISLAISNSHISIDDSRPLVPNAINAAGMHIKKKPEPLPKELQDFMDKSVDGVIFFSLGSIIPVHKLPTEMKEAFLTAFGRLKQNILWKTNKNSMENLPKNIKISKWFPQESIFAHPNCKAFITHGGLLSLQEAVYYKIPLIGIPFFADQYTNIGKATNAGYAVELSHKNITTESLLWAISEVVYNNQYRDSVAKHSQIFRDNPLEIIDNAVYWIEYVIRYKGAPHLRSKKLDLTVVQYLLIDVIFIIILIIIVSILIMYFISKYLIRKILKFNNCTRTTAITKNKKDS